jgi:hypothetical protein
MIPKEKAQELVDKFQKKLFYYVTDEMLDILEAKGCALIAVDEILDMLIGSTATIDYWLEVKEEINKL